MVGNKHALQPRIHRPSPLQQVAHTRPLSQAPPTPGAVRDSLFWKRFSTAVHQTESSKDEEAGTQSSSRSFDAKYCDDRWLTQQHKEQRRCRIVCASITLVVVIVITAAAIVGWYFTHGEKPGSMS